MKITKLEDNYIDCLTVKNAIITATEIQLEHDILTNWITVNYDDSSFQAFGGHCLKDSNFYKWTEGILKVMEVNKWEDLKGKYCRVAIHKNYGTIVGMGNIIKDKWFPPAIFFDFKEINYETLNRHYRLFFV